ncbi:MAG: hypothetical protein K9L75_02685 [Spirochaetia bacterium]|nr:hypothetical protein [Spirochaetia bacterium]
MKREPGRKTVGAAVDEKLWQELRIQAFREGRKTGQLLDDSIKLYLNKINTESEDIKKN